MADKNNTNKECLPKLATGIRGLDKLLYDGINVNTVDGDNNILIVIKGDVEENDKTLLGYMTLVNLALGAFATFAFVILRGKLNSFYLQIPILLNLMVYFYAISQMFGPLTMLAEGTNYLVNSNHAVEANVGQFMGIIGDDFQKGQTVKELIKTITENVSIAFLLGSLFGKLCLTMVLYWIVYKFRFIYFVITKSLSLTETPEKIKVFWRYIGEKGE